MCKELAAFPGLSHSIDNKETKIDKEVFYTPAVNGNEVNNVCYLFDYYLLPDWHLSLRLVQRLVCMHPFV